MMRGLGRACAAGVVAVLMASGMANAAFAIAPTDVTPEAGFAESVKPLPFELAAQGASGRAQAQVVLPEASTPIVFSGEIRSNFTTPGVIVVTAADRRVAQVSAETGGPVRFELSADDAVNGVVSIGLSVVLDDQEVCFAEDTARAVLTNGALTFRYPIQPLSTVGTFLSEGVNSYRVVTIANPSPAMQQAALDAAAALAHRYPAPTKVSVVATDDAVSGDYLNRIVRIVGTQPPTGSRNALSIDNGELVVAGIGAELSSAAVALGDPATSLIESPVVTNLSAAPIFQVRDGKLSLRELGASNISLQGIGEQSATVSLPQAAFGQSIAELTLDLTGALSPLPDGGQGRVDLIWNDQLVGSVAMSKITTLERKISVQPAQMQRDNTLRIDMLYVPPGGECFPPGLPARADFNAELNFVQASAGESLPPGFARFPQVLPAGVPVAIGSGTTTAAGLTQLGDLAVALQSASPQQYTFEVLTTEQFEKDSRAGVLVGATDATFTQYGAPLRGETETTLGGKEPSFAAQIDDPFAVLQGFSRGNRNLLMLGRNDVSPANQATSDALATELSGKVLADPNGWRLLTGQVVVMGPGGELRQVDITQPLPRSRLAIMWTATGVGLVVVFIGVLLWIYVRPRRPAPPKPGHPTPAS